MENPSPQADILNTNAKLTEELAVLRRTLQNLNQRVAILDVVIAQLQLQLEQAAKQAEAIKPVPAPVESPKP